MKTGTKVALTVLTLLGGVLALTYRKVTSLTYAFENMEITPYWIDNIKPGITQSQFSLDVMLKNLTAEPFNVTGATLAVLKRIEIIYEGQTIGIANVNIDQIEVPAFGNIIIKNIPVVVKTAAIVNNLQNLQGLLAKIQLIGYIQVLNTEYQIGT